VGNTVGSCVVYLSRTSRFLTRGEARLEKLAYIDVEKTMTIHMEERIENITEDEEALIVGTLLGDAHIQKRGRSYRLKIEHSMHQSEYVEWKYKKLQRLCNPDKGPKQTLLKNTRRSVGALGGRFAQMHFYTRSGIWLEPYHKMFYTEKERNKGELRPTKVITRNLIDHLPMNPITLATFFMDDGSVRNDCAGAKLATQCWSLEENHLLNEYLGKWGIHCQVVAHIKRKNQYYLSIPAKSFRILREVIEPVVNEIPRPPRVSSKRGDMS